MEILFQTKLICKCKKIQAHYLCPGNEVEGNQDEWFTLKAGKKGNSVLGHSHVSALQVKLSTERFSNILDTKYAFIMANLWHEEAHTYITKKGFILSTLYLHFLSFLKIKMAQVVEIISNSWQGFVYFAKSV